MMRVHAMTLVAGALGALAVVGIASATPLSNAAAGLKLNAGNSSLIERVHGCNHVCRRGPVPEWAGVVEWHRHVGQFCRPIHCTPGE
jgi:hypothetical protein